MIAEQTIVAKNFKLTFFIDLKAIFGYNYARMKKIKSLSDNELHDQVVQCAQNEKQATLLLLEHLVEIDRRRLFALYGYASLWEYVCKELNFSESQSYERVNAMRLITRAPEVRQEMQNGNLSLTSAAKLGSHASREKLSSEKTKELLPMVVHKSVREVEIALLNHQQELHPEKIITRPDQIKPLTKEITRITIDCDPELMQLLEQVKNLAGNPSSQPKDVFKIALKDFVKRRLPKAAPSTADKMTAENKVESKSNSLGSIQVSVRHEKAKTAKRARYTPSKTKIIVRNRANHQCEFISPITNKQCAHKANLEIDHMLSFYVNTQKEKSSPFPSSMIGKFN